MLNRIVAFVLLCASVALGAPTLVTVSQTLYRADGTPYHGYVSIAWQAFDAASGDHVPAGTKQVNLDVNGLLSVQLVANVGATPTGTRYTVSYRLDNGQPRNVSWTVPASGPVTVTAIESTTLVPPSSVVALSQLGQGGATANQCLIWSTSLGWIAGNCSSAASAFNAITTGTNTTATMTVGTGGSLLRSGSGIIDANKILGTTLTGITGVVKMTAGIPSQALAGTDFESGLTFTTGLNRSTNTVNCVDGAADGSTKGCSAFTAADFNSSSGLISLDYINGQKATGSVPGFLASADWTTFNNKQSTVSIVNDTNIQGSISGGVITLAWASTLPKARIIGTAVYNDQANTYSAGLQDLHSATARLPESVVGSLPSAAANTNHVYVVTDGVSASDCTAGSGTARALCISNGGSWVALGGGAGGGGANTALSNLASVSINQSLVPQANLDLGAVANPWRRAYLAGYEDITKTALPANPAAGFIRVYGDSSSGLLACIDETGASCNPTGGGGSTAFSALTGSTNTTATMLVGAGASLGFTSTGSVAANKIAAAAVAVRVVTFSATPTFNLSLGTIQKITLTANVTSSTFSNPSSGVLYTFKICQDGTGGRTFVFPTALKRATTISPTASLCSIQTFTYESDASEYNAVSAGVETAVSFMGTWNSSTAYAVNDMVVSSGFAYVALLSNTNVALTASATWKPLVGDNNNNISTPGSISTGVGSGNAGLAALTGGTQSVSVAPANSTGFIGPASQTGQHFYQPPGTASAAHQVWVWGAESSAVGIAAFKTIPDCPLGALTFTQSTDAFGCVPPSGATTSQIYSTSVVTVPITGDWSTIGTGCTRSTSFTGPTGGATLNITGTTGTANICGYQHSVSAGDFTKTFIFFCAVPNGASTTDSFIGFTDGTKVEGMGCTEPGTNVGSGAITGIKSTALTGGTYTASNGLISLAVTTTPAPIIAQLVRTGTTLTGKVSFDGGVTFTTIFNDTSPFLTASALMVYVDPRGATGTVAGASTLISYN